MKTKKEKVRDYLIENGKITSWEAIQKFNATRLSAIIWELRDEGMKINSITKYSKKERTKYTSYELESIELINFK